MKNLFLTNVLRTVKCQTIGYELLSRKIHVLGNIIRTIFIAFMNHLSNHYPPFDKIVHFNVSTAAFFSLQYILNLRREWWSTSTLSQFELSAAENSFSVSFEFKSCKIYT